MSLRDLTVQIFTLSLRDIIISHGSLFIVVYHRLHLAENLLD
jgi:hypothetical protein